MIPTKQNDALWNVTVFGKVFNAIFTFVFPIYSINTFNQGVSDNLPLILLFLYVVYIFYDLWSYNFVWPEQ